MKVPTNHNRIQVLAATALATFALALAWSASVSAATPSSEPRSAAALILPKASTRAIDQQEPKSQETATGAKRPVYVPPARAPAVTSAASPSINGNTDTLPIVLASVALIVAAGGIAFTVLAGGRMRRAPQPQA